MTEKYEVERGLAGVTLVTLVIILVVGLLSGCSGSTGWRVSFGVAPVSQIRDVASLQGNQEDTRVVKRSPAKRSDKNPEEDY